MRVHRAAGAGVLLVVLAAAPGTYAASLPPRVMAGCAAAQSTRLSRPSNGPVTWDRSLPRLESQPAARPTSRKEVPKALRWTAIGLMAVGGGLYVWGSASGEMSELREHGAMVAGSGVVLMTIGIAIRDRR